MWTSRWGCLLFILLCLAPPGSRAQSPEQTPADDMTPAASGEAAQGPIRDAAPVLVTGALPGPGLWKVSRGDHVMYVLGTVSPLPRRMEWVSREVEQVLEQAGEVLLGSSFVVDFDAGFFGKLALVPSLLRARRNPGDAELRETVSPQSYERWLELKQRYIGRDRAVEKWRPGIAAMHLYGEAIDEQGLVWSGIVGPVVERAIRRRDIRRTEPRLKLKIEEPRAAIREFRSEALDDLECFDKTLQNLETDLGRMAERANAWAVGDIETLRRLPLGDQFQACRQAFIGAEVARRHGLADAEARAKEVWLSAARTALDRNAVSFAVLPMSQLLASDGYLAGLQGLGYAVEAP